MGLGLQGSSVIAPDGDKIKSLFVTETDKPVEREQEDGRDVATTRT